MFTVVEVEPGIYPVVEDPDGQGAVSEHAEIADG